VAVSNQDLIAELQTLIRLTETEAAVASARRAQARDPRIDRELARNAQDAGRRRDRLAEAIRALGGTPDLIGSALSRVGTLARTQVIDQTTPVREALMSDLALEHQLRDRARFARVLAEAAGEAKVVKLLGNLESSHGETITWIETRLAEVAVGGPAAIMASPVQTAAAAGQRIVTLPARAIVDGMNRALIGLNTARTAATERIDRTAERVQSIGEAAQVAATSARNAFLEATEDQAVAKGATSTARSVHQARADAGALYEEELPIRNFDRLPVQRAVAQIARLREAGDVRAVLAYEEANKARKGIVTGAVRRLEELAEHEASRN
jgi:bacterioferritin (cytochrome b1)